MGNIRCSLEREKVSCAIPCGRLVFRLSIWKKIYLSSECTRLMSCGFHRCQRLCHAADCGPCTAQCGKDRKLWYDDPRHIPLLLAYTFCSLPSHHLCTRPCHAPSACPEDEPCEALVSISCPCGRIKQSLRCGISVSNPAGAASSGTLKCNSQCEIAKRNARLAEALGISEESRDRAGKHMAGGPAVYHDEVVAFAKEDPKFVLLVEKTFAEYAKVRLHAVYSDDILSRFILSNKRSQVLPHMTQEKRKFVYSVSTPTSILPPIIAYVALARRCIQARRANGRSRASSERSSRSPA